MKILSNNLEPQIINKAKHLSQICLVMILLKIKKYLININYNFQIEYEITIIPTEGA